MDVNLRHVQGDNRLLNQCPKDLAGRRRTAEVAPQPPLKLSRSARVGLAATTIQGIIYELSILRPRTIKRDGAVEGAKLEHTQDAASPGTFFFVPEEGQAFTSNIYDGLYTKITVHRRKLQS